MKSIIVLATILSSINIYCSYPVDAHSNNKERQTIVPPRLIMPAPSPVQIHISPYSNTSPSSKITHSPLVTPRSFTNEPPQVPNEGMPAAILILIKPHAAKKNSSGPKALADNKKDLEDSNKKK